MNSELRSILLQLVSEVENLKANQSVLLGRSIGPMTVEGAQKTKEAALKSSIEDFDKLREQIEALA